MAKQQQTNFVRRYSHLCFALSLVAAAGVQGCNRTQNPPARKSSTSGPAAAVETTTFQGVGVVKATNPKFPSIELDHEDIKGLMPAMTMEFYVKDKSLLEGIKPGDRVEFTIENGVGGEKITAIRRL